MNTSFAREVGIFRFVLRRIVWRLNPPKEMTLHNGVRFPTPKEKFFASDVYVSNANVDWLSEYILCAYLGSQDSKGDFIDVGAHIGYYSCLLNPYVESIYAFEPDSRNRSYLDSAFSSISAAKIIPSAVADYDGEVSFSDEGGSSVSHIDSSGESSTQVDVTKIDTFVSQNEVCPASIKMDIEGFEILALQGGKKTFLKYHPVLLIEYEQERSRPNSWDKLQGFVDEVDYCIFAVTRVRKNWNCYSYSFSEWKAKELEGKESKMLFLVSNSHRTWFDEFSKSNGKWENKQMRPKAIRAFLKKFEG